MHILTRHTHIQSASIPASTYTHIRHIMLQPSSSTCKRANAPLWRFFSVFPFRDASSLHQYPTPCNATFQKRSVRRPHHAPITVATQTFSFSHSLLPQHPSFFHLFFFATRAAPPHPTHTLIQTNNNPPTLPLSDPTRHGIGCPPIIVFGDRWKAQSIAFSLIFSVSKSL